jgi:hypothetical protein
MRYYPRFHGMWFPFIGAGNHLFALCTVKTFKKKSLKRRIETGLPSEFLDEKARPTRWEKGLSKKQSLMIYWRTPGPGKPRLDL